MQDFIQNCFRYLISLFKNFFFKKKIFYIIEYKKWANFNDAVNLKKFFKKKLTISNEIVGIKKSIIHIGTHYKLFLKKKIIDVHHSNKLIVFWPHLDKGNYISSLLKKNILKIFKINTCSKTTKKNLIKYGISKDKIILTPLSIDMKIFNPISVIKKNKLKEKYGIPKDKLVLGSFVKDGVGFEDGNKPKEIKNPQMLVKSLKASQFKDNFYFVLSGPARGYLKKSLNKLGIKFIHKECRNSHELAELYKLVDITIINSKLEGGPYTLLESLSTGVPVISTKVGMSLDIIRNSYNGYLININDHILLKNKLNFLLYNRNKIKNLKKNCRNSIKNYSINKIVKIYQKKLYNLF